MASPRPESDASSMFIDQSSGKSSSPSRSDLSSRRSSLSKSVPAEIITVKDFFDFMKTAYQVYEHIEGTDDDGARINWEELTKLTVLNHMIEQQERDLLYQSAFSDPKPISSKSDTTLERTHPSERTKKRNSCSEIEGKSCERKPPEARVEMLGVWTEANLNCKLNDVINEGILDSILPYLVGYKKCSKTSSVYTPIIKKTVSANEIRKPASFGGFLEEKGSRDRLGRRKSSVIISQERVQNQKLEGDVEIHVCDEVKGLKKDFRCPQKLLVSKMGYFADVTAGQRLEDMDISVHCDIQIFDWLMRWVKRDTILVADWPMFDAHNVIPILVSASFLQMEPLLHDCLTYCHAHMNDIVKTSTNLACLSDALLSRLAAMYTNVELEAVRDRKDKVVSRLFCKMIASLAEPVPETLRGHHATLATLFKCSKCNKLLGRHIAKQVPCQPANMRIDRRGNVVATHTRDTSWSLSEYVTWLHGELRSWRRVYWRLWAESHFLRCVLCDMHYPVYQMEWCSHHEQPATMFATEGRAPLPTGRYPCCGERAYRFETISRNTGCQFREHAPDETLAGDAAVAAVCARFREIVAMKPPQLVFPERLTRLVPREGGGGEEGATGRLQCKEVFWWEGLQLAPPRAPFGLLAALYSSDTKFNPNARPGSPGLWSTTHSNPSAASNSTDLSELKPLAPPPATEESPRNKKGATGDGDPDLACDDLSSDSDESEQSSSGRSDEECPRRRYGPPAPVQSRPVRRGGRVQGRQWVASLSARSNQDGQRRFEERAARHMRLALAKRAANAAPRAKLPPGGIYAKLEAEWRERHGQRPRNVVSVRPRQPNNKYK